MTVQGEFEAAVATANHALEEFNKEPLVDGLEEGRPTVKPNVEGVRPSLRGCGALAQTDASRTGANA
jgi:hypothetical protein